MGNGFERGYIGFVLELLRLLVFCCYFVSWDTCVCLDFVYENYVLGPIYVKDNCGYGEFDWVMLLWGWVIVEYEYTIEVVREDVGV